jgi:hypothetical protein
MHLPFSIYAVQGLEQGIFDQYIKKSKINQGIPLPFIGVQLKPIKKTKTHNKFY